MRSGPTIGSELKTKLGLDNFKYVSIVRVLSISYRTYLVVYNSRYLNLPITNTMVYSAQMPSMIYTYPFSRKPNMGPVQKIEDFNGSLDGSLFFMIDLAGYLGNPNLRTRIIENKVYSKSLKSLTEGLLLSDIKTNAISDLNKKFLNLRRTDGKSGSYFKDANWIESDDSVYLVFHVNPTYDKTVTNYSPSGNEYKDNKYIVQVQFEEVSKVLGDKETFKSFTPKEQGELVLQMINECEIKLWSSDPSFVFQGAFEAMSDLGASIYPMWGPRHSTGIWAQRHGTEIHETKHISEILEIIPALYQDISIKLRNLKESWRDIPRTQDPGREEKMQRKINRDRRPSCGKGNALSEPIFSNDKLVGWKCRYCGEVTK